MRSWSLSVLTILMLAASANVAGAEEREASAEQIEGGDPAGMMTRYLTRLPDRAIERWKADYENRKTPEQIAAYQKKAREDCLKAIGGLPDRTPLES